VHGPATHVLDVTHGGWAFICRARPPHAPVIPVAQQLRPVAQSLFVAQLAPARCFEAVAVAVAVTVAVGVAVAVAVAVTVVVTVDVAVAVAVTSGALDAAGAIVTVDAD